MFLSILKIFNPSFFDIFGIFVFLFLIIFSVWGLKTKKSLPEIILFIILLIGIFGLIIDSISVYTAYFLGS